MLVLGRLEGEAIVIRPGMGLLPGSPPIRVHVVSIRGDKVRLGFDAPTSVAINRKEIDDQIQGERAAAARLVKP